VQRWRNVLFKRVERRARRGTASKLHLAKVSAFLVAHSHWVRRRGFTAKSIARVIDTAIKFAKNVKSVTPQLGTGVSAGAPADDVEQLISAEAGYWRCSTEKVETSALVVSKTLPLVGGFHRGSAAYEGPPPDDAPPGWTINRKDDDIVFCGGGGGGDDHCSMSPSY